MKVLVTGAAGLVGSHLVDRLLELGHAVSAVDDLSTGSLGHLAAARAAGGLSFSRLDVAGDGFAERVARDTPEVVVHLAARPADPRDVSTTVSVLDASARAGVRKVVLVGSAGLYAGGGRPVTERAAFAPRSPAVAVQAAGEVLAAAWARSGGPTWTHVVLGSVYGPRASRGVVQVLAGALVAGRVTTLHGDGSASRDLVHVADAGDALALALSAGDGRRLHVAGGAGTTIRELHTLLAAAAGVPDAPDYGPALPGGGEGVVLDVTAARRVLGWSPQVTLAVGLRDLVERLRGRARA